MSSYSIGVSALATAQAGLLTTEHNISNVNTPGFHRQQIVQSTNIPQYTGIGFLGQGAHVDTVKRLYNQVLDGQVLQAQTQSSHLEAYYAQVTQLDNMLADPIAGVSPTLQEFFNGVQDVAANPASVPSRQAMLSGAQMMAARFQTIGQRFTEIRDGVNSEITSSVVAVNSYSRQIANINQQILVAQGATGDLQPANDLLDQRDQLIAELNKVVKVSTVKQDDGSLNVFIGNGQSLVLGGQSFAMGAAPSLEDPERIDVGVSYGGSTILLPKGSLTGGTLGGLLAFRDESLDPAQNALGRVAIGLAQTFNDQHRLGMDMNGALGGNFFNAVTPKVINNTSNSSTSALTVSFSNVGQMTTSDYRLTVGAGPVSTLTRLSDNTVMFSGATLPQTVDGLTFSAMTAVAGDSFLIKPTVNGARDISVAITDPAKIAAAASIKTNATLSNTGSGKISAGAVYPYNDKVTITFTSASTFDVVDNSSGATLATNVAYSAPAGATYAYNGWKVTLGGTPSIGDTFVVDHTISAAGSNNVGTGTVSAATPVGAQFGPDPNLQHNVTIAFIDATHYSVTDNTTSTVLTPVGGASYVSGQDISYNGWTVQITGTPATGDTFTVGSNAGGVADNRNALLLAGLQTRNTLAGNTTSYQGAYSQLVSFVGNKTREIEVTAKAQDNLVSQTKQAQQSMSGVNLDEEAANLLRYQQAYQAAGKMMQIATTLFDTLLSLGK